MRNTETGTHISYLEHQGKYNGILSWLLTTDHKRIGLMYLIRLWYSFLSRHLGVLMRIELIAPGRDNNGSADL